MPVSLSEPPHSPYHRPPPTPSPPPTAGFPSDPVISASSPFSSSPSLTRIVHSHNSAWNAAQRFPSNRISNTKYTPLTFLPLNLYQQCTQSMNKYFLLIALLQLWSTITPVNPVTTWVPLSVIFFVSALKDAIDDWRRYQADREANTRRVVRVTESGHQAVASESLQCGDVVYVTEGEEVAADLVLLKSSDPAGDAYIQTANLDGETNLKQRTALDATQRLSVDDLCRLHCTVECALPNKNIYAFDSTITLPSPQPRTFPLTTAQLLLQATHLVNTAHVYGLVVYTGNETKVGQNKNAPRMKYTRLDHEIDRTIVVLFAFQVTLIVLWGVVGSILLYQDEVARVFYLHLHVFSWFDPIVIPLRFLLLASMMIPISLKVTVDFIKLLYSLFIRWDLAMWDDVRHVGAEARNTAIAEELGAVQYVMSDKTGTLTENVMVMREMSVQDRSYGATVGEGKDLESDPDLLSALRDAEPHVVGLLRAMVVCNTVVPSSKSEEQMDLDRKKRGAESRYALQELAYASASPDELSLVQFAASLGFVLGERSGATLRAKVPGAGREEWVILGVCAFSSVRKRMSVIVRERSGKIRLLMKGADDVVLTRLSPVQAADASQWRQTLDGYARKGLRTLVFAGREVSEAEWKDWLVKHERANLDVSDREDALARVYEEVERDCAVLGVTGIEDKLQEDVPSTLIVLRQAGIKVWMLTGDKQQTAEEIGRNSGLIAAHDTVHYLTAINAAELSTAIAALIRTVHLGSDSPDPYSLVVDGATLSLCLLHQARDFYALSSTAISVICCRVTPYQKAAVTSLINSSGHVTLAIGDGANDCVVEGTLITLADGTSVPIEDVQVGAVVLSYSLAGGAKMEGLIARPVAAVLDRGHRMCVELLFSDGRNLVCTSNHRIRTPDRRWVAAGELVVGRDEVAVGVEYPHVTGGGEGDDEDADPYRSTDKVTCGVRHDATVLPLFPVRLVGRREVGVRHVYDLTVPGERGDEDASFVAGGICVHNCAMIQQANVGVGISGREGLQAARASDFSIGRFSYLTRLLLVHGRWSYVRTSWISQYCLYKSMIICLVQLLFAVPSRFSGASFFDSISIVSWNLFYTSLLGGFYVFEQDLLAPTLLASPHLYSRSREGQCFNRRTLVHWFTRSAYQAAVISLIAFYSSLGTTGNGLTDHNQQAVALIAYSSCVFVQLLTLYIEMSYITLLNHLIIWGTLVAFFVINLVVSSSNVTEATGVFTALLRDPVYWLSVALGVTACVLPVVGAKYAWKMYWPTEHDRAHEHEVKHGLHDGNSNRLPSAADLLLSGGLHPAYSPSGGTAACHTPNSISLMQTLRAKRKRQRQRKEKRESKKALMQDNDDDDHEGRVGGLTYHNSADDRGDSADMEDDPSLLSDEEEEEHKMDDAGADAEADASILLGGLDEEEAKRFDADEQPLDPDDSLSSVDMDAEVELRTRQPSVT